MNPFLLILLCIGGAILFLWEVWTRYLAIMSLYRAERAGTLPKSSRIAGMPLLAYGYFIDFVGNMLVCILFLDLPRELLITSRLQRYVDGPDGRRRRMAIWFAEHLLDPFDPKGHHVRQPVPEPKPATAA